MSITESIYQAAEASGLLVDRHHLPIKLGPDVYVFNATPLTDQCHKWGDCKEGRYYALTGGQEVKIQQGGAL